VKARAFGTTPANVRCVYLPFRSRLTTRGSQLLCYNEVLP